MFVAISESLKVNKNIRILLFSYVFKLSIFIVDLFSLKSYRFIQEMEWKNVVNRNVFYIIITFS